MTSSGPSGPPNETTRSGVVGRPLSHEPAGRGRAGLHLGRLRSMRSVSRRSAKAVARPAPSPWPPARSRTGRTMISVHTLTSRSSCQPGDDRVALAARRRMDLEAAQLAPGHQLVADHPDDVEPAAVGHHPGLQRPPGQDQRSGCAAGTTTQT